jgi:hypothetical protein
MELTKEIVIDRIEVLENGIIQVRQATKIIEDGVELSQSFQRWSIAPGQDYSDQPDNVKAICQVTHTQVVVDAYNEKLRLENERLGQ